MMGRLDLVVHWVVLSMGVFGVAGMLLAGTRPDWVTVIAVTVFTVTAYELVDYYQTRRRLRHSVPFLVAWAKDKQEREAAR